MKYFRNPSDGRIYVFAQDTTRDQSAGWQEVNEETYQREQNPFFTPTPAPTRSEPLRSDATGFRKELEQLINAHSMENGSNTPDFLLADYIANCLKNFDETVKRRDKWYGRDNS